MLIVFLANRNNPTKSTNNLDKKAAFWDKRLSAGQRRYLRACETLARVRKITRATMQINIAGPGSQQLNVAGDLVTKGGDLSGK
jgi:hypothetical protein